MLTNNTPKEHGNSNATIQKSKMPQSFSLATDVGSIPADFHACPAGCGMPSPIGQGRFRTRRTSHHANNTPLHKHNHLWQKPGILTAQMRRGT